MTTVQLDTHFASIKNLDRNLHNNLSISRLSATLLSLALSPSPEPKIQWLNNYEYKKEKNLGFKKRNFIKKKKNLHVDLHIYLQKV